MLIHLILFLSTLVLYFRLSFTLIVSYLNLQINRLVNEKKNHLQEYEQQTIITASVFRKDIDIRLLRVSKLNKSCFLRDENKLFICLVVCTNWFVPPLNTVIDFGGHGNLDWFLHHFMQFCYLMPRVSCTVLLLFLVSLGMSNLDLKRVRLAL